MDKIEQFRQWLEEEKQESLDWHRITKDEYHRGEVSAFGIALDKFNKLFPKTTTKDANS